MCVNFVLRILPFCKERTIRKVMEGIENSPDAPIFFCSQIYHV